MGVGIREARPGEEERIVPLYAWLFGEPGYLPPGWGSERARRARRRGRRRADRAVHRLPGAQLGALRTALLGRGPRGRPAATLPGSGRKAARRRRRLGAGARRDPHRARHRPGAHRRAAFLRAARAGRGRLQLLLEALSGRRRARRRYPAFFLLAGLSTALSREGPRRKAPIPRQEERL